MAVKNELKRSYPQSAEVIAQVLRHPDFAQCLDARFLEEAIMADGTEFRYIRETTMTRYGRNYFIKLVKLSDGQTEVTVTTQSRKVTVLWDTAWKKEVERTFGFLDMLLRR